MPRQTNPPGYGEPWHYAHPHVRDRNNVQVYADPRNKERMAQCVTALAGADPHTMKRLIQSVERSIAEPSKEASAALKKSLDAFQGQDSGVLPGSPHDDQVVREMLGVIIALTGALVDAVAVNAWVYGQGTAKQVVQAVLLKPNSLRGWKLRAHKALARASYYTTIPTPKADYDEMDVHIDE